MHVVRNFETTDQDRVRRLVLDGLSERWGPEFDESFNRDLDDITANYIDPGADVIVIEDCGELVAVGILISIGDRLGQLVRISVASTRRRQGLAQLVVRELVDRARTRGMTELRVLTDTPWHSAVELYRSCGFEETGRDDTDTHFRLALG